MSLKILDVGCNFPAWALERHLKNEEFDYLGIEISPETITQEPVFGIDYLRQNYPNAIAKYTNPDGSWKELPENFSINFNTNAFDWLTKSDEQYDVIYLSNILHELPDTWKELYQLCLDRLKKGGKIYISVYYNQSTDGEFYLTTEDLVYLKAGFHIYEEIQNGALHQFWLEKTY